MHGNTPCTHDLTSRHTASAAETAANAHHAIDADAWNLGVCRLVVVKRSVCVQGERWCLGFVAAN